jgi:energy-coupling factor transporter ATP-binding protein EcfA2
VLSNSSKLEGVGTESWKLLWSAAKEYSQKDAYLDDKKLYQHDRCVLCHQILDEETKTRLQNFDTFITNELSQIATDAKKRYNDRINSLPKDFTEDQIIDRCISAGLDRDWGKQIFNIWIQIYNNGEAIRLKRPLLNIYNDAQIALSALKEKSRRYEVTAAEYENDTKSFDRDAAAKQLLELKAQKWAFEQYEAIKIEQSRQMNVIRYDQWISQTNTRGITTKANEIGDLVITQSFVKRFNEELDKLGAGNIQVEFVKQINKGTTKHVLKIANATHNNPENILSEGEARIISLAAFLADVTGGNYANPFVFDDPISSLDQTYEEKTVKRLVELSKSRQVIVFTHRLSLLCQLNDACDNIKTLGIRRESWGTGEIGELPMSAKSPKNALKDILNNKLVRAKKVLNENGAEEYYLHAKMICSDFRILIERTVEYHLLGDVVQRYRRAVNTMGKVSSLAKINKHDCEMIDKFMTKYSFYEHSQPLEAPVELPLPDDISNDVNELLAWIEEFDKRKIID